MPMQQGHSRGLDFPLVHYSFDLSQSTKHIELNKICTWNFSTRMVPFQIKCSCFFCEAARVFKYFSSYFASPYWHFSNWDRHIVSLEGNSHAANALFQCCHLGLPPLFQPLSRKTISRLKISVIKPEGQFSRF